MQQEDTEVKYKSGVWVGLHPVPKSRGLPSINNTYFLHNIISLMTYIPHVESYLEVLSEGVVEFRIQIQYIQQIIPMYLVQITVR